MKRHHYIIMAVALLVLVSLVVVRGEQTTPIPIGSALPTETIRYRLYFGKEKTVTVGDNVDEITSITLYTTTTQIVVQGTGANGIMNWWSTNQSQVVSTGGILIVADATPQVWDNYLFGATVADSPTWSSTSVVLWLGARSAGASATLSVREFSGWPD